MDLASIEQRLVEGENLKIKYRYPLQDSKGNAYGVRTDKLHDVSVELNRAYTKFRGESAIWVELDEIIEIVSDDGVYEDFTL